MECSSKCPFQLKVLCTDKIVTITTSTSAVKKCIFFSSDQNIFSWVFFKTIGWVSIEGKWKQNCWGLVNSLSKNWIRPQTSLNRGVRLICSNCMSIPEGWFAYLILILKSSIRWLEWVFVWFLKIFLSIWVEFSFICCLLRLASGKSYDLYTFSILLKAFWGCPRWPNSDSLWCLQAAEARAWASLCFPGPTRKRRAQILFVQTKPMGRSWS